MKTLKQAVEARGGVTAAAVLLEITPQRLSNWMERGVPTEHCARVEAALGIARQDMRPDDWQAIWPELAKAA
jgi:DNA-binding transcriptional regulator YdaS (Cro superfamily)